MAKVNLFELGKKLSQKGDLSSINSMLIIEPENSVGSKFRSLQTLEARENCSETILPEILEPDLS